ncbi:hypothetical protein [Thalassococcus lentus]|uniref:Uncharacterized protein n=1 Tax=Thalassococcus lentus TaxID=1210524 RepID=A0ABT4XPB4_9RHOB|nr:hypothetical protein [Thalassococcus lentus]MDA7423792.1 hypothetical protein [Thalassococcus lentus]
MRNLLFSLAVVLASPAFGLSCLPPDIASDFKYANDSEDIWVVVEGTVRFDEKKLPKVNMKRQDKTPPHTDIPARFKGKSLSDTGFDRRFETPITLRIQCFGPWCGGASSGANYLTFLKKEKGSYVMMADPCGGMTYPGGSDDLRKKVLSCFQGKACDSEPLR